MAESKSLRIAYGEALAELGAENDKIVVLDADLSNATMTNRFSAVYPDRFFDFGIAEANMACAAAGFAHEGLIPFISTFALFGAGRAYEQIRNSIAYVNANVKFGFSHSGLCVGEDGGSHQSIEDIALMRVMPNMTIFVPCDAVEVRKAVRAAAAIEGPVYIRVARPVCECFTDEHALCARKGEHHARGRRRGHHRHGPDGGRGAEGRRPAGGGGHPGHCGEHAHGEAAGRGCGFVRG